MDDAERIDLLFRSVLGRFFAIPARQPATGATTFAQMRVLWVLEQRHSAALHELARNLGITSSAATELVDRLVERGYVRRVQSDEDRRRVVLGLLPKGRRLVAQLTAQRRARFQKLLHVVDRRDVARLAGALDTVNEVLGKWKE